MLKNQGRNSGYGLMKLHRKDGVRKQALFLMNAAKASKAQRTFEAFESAAHGL